MTPSPHIVVRASAGTGKTYRLTVEIIRLLAAGGDPGTILATTFTRKAAGQILGRTFELLGRAAADDAALKNLRAAVPGLTRSLCTELTTRLAADIHRLNILTIDAFFARLASGFALECGMAPGWKMMTEEELERAHSDAVTDALSEPIPGHDARDRRLALAMALHKGGAGRSVHADALRAVTLAQSALGEPVADHAWDVIGPETGPLGSHEIDNLLTRLVAAPVPLTRELEPNRKWTAAITDIVESARTGDWETLLEKVLVVRIAEGGADFNGVPVPDAIRSLLTPLVAHAAAIESARLRDRNAATGALLSRFDTALQRRKQSEGRYFFDDLPRLLLATGATGRLADLYYRLDASIRHLLLDEFQDTSLTQFRLLEPIIDELASSADGSVFCVGDPKQSLYTWRGGRAELLLRLRGRWPQFQEQSLDVNFRSSPVVIRAVNDVFTELGTNPALDQRRDAAVAWSSRFPRHEAHQKDLTGIVRLWDASIAGRDSAGAPTPVDAYRFAARRAQEIAAEHPSFTIGILVRTNSPTPRLLQELDRLGLGASKEGGVPLLASPPAAAAAGLLHLADHPGDSAALFLVATSPLGRAVGLTRPRDGAAARKIASRIRRDLLESGYAAVLTRWLHAIAPEIDAHAFERFERLIDLAHEFDAAGAGLHPSEFARVIRDRAVDDPSAERIRVMTIHRAKGLEFDAVILPQLCYQWTLRSTILVDRRDDSGAPDPLGRVTAATWSGSTELRRVNAPLRDLYERARSAQTEEELCALYVAMTRAKRILEMILPAKPSNALSAATILRSALASGNGPAPGGLVFEDAEPVTEVDARTIAAPDPVPVRITLAPADPPPHRWASRAPSSLGKRQSIADLFAAPSLAVERGTVIHAWLEKIGWLDDSTPSDRDLLALSETTNCRGLTPAEDLPAFRRAIRSDARIGRLLRRAEYAGRPADELQCKAEWSFAVPGSRPGTLVSGRFDRVVIGLRSGRPAWAEVIDFKTDAIAEGPAPARAGAQTHRAQMHAYRDAAASLLSLDPAAVTAVVAFIHTGRIIRFRDRHHAAP